MFTLIWFTIFTKRGSLHELEEDYVGIILSHYSILTLRDPSPLIIIGRENAAAFLSRLTEMVWKALALRDREV